MSIRIRPSTPKTEGEIMTDILYGSFDQENLTATTLEEAVGEAIDGLAPECIEELEVWEFERMPFNAHSYQPLERLLEDIDEDFYCDGMTGPTEPNERMLYAEQAFLDVIQDEYMPSAFEPVRKHVVNVTLIEDYPYFTIDSIR